MRDNRINLDYPFISSNKISSLSKLCLLLIIDDYLKNTKTSAVSLEKRLGTDLAEIKITCEYLCSIKYINILGAYYSPNMKLIEKNNAATESITENISASAPASDNPASATKTETKVSRKENSPTFYLFKSDVNASGYITSNNGFVVLANSIISSTRKITSTGTTNSLRKQYKDVITDKFRLTEDIPFKSANEATNFCVWGIGNTTSDWITNTGTTLKEYRLHPNSEETDNVPVPNSTYQQTTTFELQKKLDEHVASTPSSDKQIKISTITNEETSVKEVPVSQKSESQETTTKIATEEKWIPLNFSNSDLIINNSKQTEEHSGVIEAPAVDVKPDLQGEEEKTNTLPRETITQYISLSKMENIIKNNIAECEYWGDFNLSDAEFSAIRYKLRASLKNNVSIHLICVNYPCVITTYMVFFARYKYNTNFWGALSADLEFDLTQNTAPELGRCAKNMFRKYNFDISETEGDQHVYLAPILYEACLPPDSCLSDLFYILSFDTFGTFDPKAVIDELIEMKSYTIRKPLFRFLSKFRDDRAVEFILEVMDAISASNQVSANASRYIERFNEWKIQEKNNYTYRGRKNQEFQTNPYLYFDTNQNGLCIMLPRIILENGWIDEVKWEIEGTNGFSKQILCNVFGSDEVRYIEPLAIPVSPNEQYTVTLLDSEGIDDKLTITWQVSGVPLDKIIAFNPNGRQVNPHNLLSPFTILIIPNSFVHKNSEQVDITELYYPTTTNEYNIVSIIPFSNQSFVEYSNGVSLYKLESRPQVKLSLLGASLFGLSDIGLPTNTYVNIPNLKIEYDGSQNNTGYELHIGKSVLPITFTDGECDINLQENFSDEFIDYGKYNIRLYRLNRFVKQIEFIYVPKIRTNYSPKISWVTSDSRKEKKNYRFYKLSDWELSFSNCIVNESEDYYDIICNSDVGDIHFSLKPFSDEYTLNCELDLPVNPVELNLLDNNGDLIEKVTDKRHRIGVNDLIENDKWLSVKLFGAYINSSIKIELASANGTEQLKRLHLSHKGSGNISLTDFYDTIRTCPLPAVLNIVCDDDPNMKLPFIVIDESVAFANTPKYKKTNSGDYFVLGLKDHGKDINVTRFGFDIKTYHIPFSRTEEFRMKTKNGMEFIAHGYEYPEIAKPGVYIISGNKEDSLFDFEEEEKVDFSSNNAIVYVPEFSGNIHTTREWLDLLLKNATQTRKDEDIITMNAYKFMTCDDFLTRLEISHFIDEDIERLVALSYIVNSKIINAKKESIRECMRFISMHLLHRGDRFRIIKLLAELECPQEVFDTCLSDYSLLLFYEENEDCKLMASMIEKYSTPLSMLLTMSTDAPLRETLRENNRDLIGGKALLELIDVRGSDDEQIKKEERKKFLSEIPGSKVTIGLSDEISGNQEMINNMIVIPSYGDPYFDIKRKPDYGILFAKINYVDQYVNWFKTTHNYKCEMKPEINNRINLIVKSTYEAIDKAYKYIFKDYELSKIAKPYYRTICLRYEDYNSNYAPKSVGKPLYFLMQGLAAFLAKLPADRTDLDEYRNTGIEFMSMASVIAPKLSQRDILMAGTYLYLKRKEAKLCR